MDQPVFASIYKSRHEVTTHRLIWIIENFLVVIKKDSVFGPQICTFDTQGVGSVGQLGWELNLKKTENLIDACLKLKTVDGMDANTMKDLRICAQPSLSKLKSLPGDECIKSPVDIPVEFKPFDCDEIVKGSFWLKFIEIDNIADYLDKGTLHIELKMNIFHKTSIQKSMSTFLDNFHLKSIPKAEKIIANAVIRGSISFSEVKIIAGDNKEISTKWGVLAARSPVFLANYSADMEEKKTGVIQMPEISGKAAKVLIHFIETGELLSEWNDDEVLPELVNAAAMYELTDLLEFLDDVIGAILCEDEGKNEMSLECAWKLLSFAHKLDLKNAEKRLLAWVKKKSMGSAEDFLKHFQFISLQK